MSDLKICAIIDRFTSKIHELEALTNIFDEFSYDLSEGDKELWRLRSKEFEKEIITLFDDAYNIVLHGI